MPHFRKFKGRSFIQLQDEPKTKAAAEKLTKKYRKDGMEIELVEIPAIPKVRKKAWKLYMNRENLDAELLKKEKK